MNPYLNKPAIYKHFLLMACILLFLAFTAIGHALKRETLSIAVASNFYEVALEIADAFEQKTGLEVRVSSASSSVLMNQIIKGAAYDIFLSADEARVDALIKEGFVKDKYSDIYARGRLLLLARFGKAAVSGSQSNSAKACALFQPTPERKTIILAKPELAPYGFAAMQYMQDQGINLQDNASLKVIYSQNVSQAAQFFYQSDVDYVWLSYSQARLLQKFSEKRGGKHEYCSYLPELNAYPAILQKMALVKPESESALALWRYFQSQEVKEILLEKGYALPENRKL